MTCSTECPHSREVLLVPRPQGLSKHIAAVPRAADRVPGLELGAYGAILALFLVFEPLGIYGRWLKIRA